MRIALTYRETSACHAIGARASSNLFALRIAARILILGNAMATGKANQVQ